MENCLKTTLKAEVQNDNLQILGNMRVGYSELTANTQYHYPIVKANKAVILTIIGDATWDSGQANTTIVADSGSKKLQIAADTKFNPGPAFTTGSTGGNITINISDKYALVEFNNTGTNQSNVQVDASEFGYLVNLYKLYLTTNVNVKGDVKHFGSDTKLTTLSVVASTSNDKLVGDIIALSNLTLLTSISMPKNTALSGNLNDLLDALYANGKRGALSVNFKNCAVSYTGTKSVSTTVIDFTFNNNGWSEDA